jgi:hypothetical protein
MMSKGTEMCRLLLFLLFMGVMVDLLEFQLKAVGWIDGLTDLLT